MPTYEYVCANGHRTEVMHGIHAPGPESCPACGAPVRKAFLAPTFHFKGSGWAKVDRRSSTGPKKTEGDVAAAGVGPDAASATSPASGSEGEGSGESGRESSSTPAEKGGPGSAERGGSATSDSPKSPGGASSAASASKKSRSSA